MPKSPSQNINDEYRKNLAEECMERTQRLTLDNGGSFLMLEEHQQDAMLDTAVALDERKDRFSVVHPGGSGKTVLEAAIVQASQAAKSGLTPDMQDTKDIILTVERALTENVRGHIQRVLHQDIGVWGSGEKELEPSVIVASIQALQHNKKNIDKYLDPGKVSLVIGDEADKFLTDAREKILKRFGSAIHIGLTATPEWPDGRRIDTVWGDIVNYLTLKEGIKRGINVPPRYWLYEADIDIDEIKINNGDYETASLETAMKLVQVETAVANIYSSTIPERLRKEYPTLVYVPSVNTVGHTVERLKKEFPGLAISSWTGDISSKQLAEEIRDFQLGKIDILVLCEMGGRGLNLPRARFIIDGYPTLSANKLEQRHARALRKIRQGTFLEQEGFKKPDALIAQIIPKANTFRQLTLLDVLDCWPDYRPGRVIGVDPRSTSGGAMEDSGRPESDEIDEIVRYIKSHPISDRIRLIEQADILQQIKLREEMLSADPDCPFGFAYIDDETGEPTTKEEHDKKYPDKK